MLHPLTPMSSSAFFSFPLPFFDPMQDCPHPPPKTARVGEVGWGVPKLSDQSLLKSGHQIMVFNIGSHSNIYWIAWSLGLVTADQERDSVPVQLHVAQSLHSTQSHTTKHMYYMFTHTHSHTHTHIHIHTPVEGVPPSC